MRTRFVPWGGSTTSALRTTPSGSSAPGFAPFPSRHTVAKDQLNAGSSGRCSWTQRTCDVVNEKVSPQTLGFARIWVYALWFQRIYIDPFYQLAELPIEILRPIGVMRYIPEALYGYICTAPGLWALKVAMLVGLALLI